MVFLETFWHDLMHKFFSHNIWLYCIFAAYFFFVLLIRIIKKSKS